MIFVLDPESLASQPTARCAGLTKERACPN